MAEIQFNNGRKPKRWVAPRIITAEADEQLKDYPTAFRQVLFNRGLETAEHARVFLQGSMDEYDPFAMKGMQEAVELILKSIKDGESIVVYGDYDVDGVTATALLVQAIRFLNGNVREYIPNRFDEGYGLNNEAVELLKNEGTDLIITVDCGIRSVREAELARELGIHLIITDHHHPLEIVPPADVVICPKQAGDEYPYKELAGLELPIKLPVRFFSRPAAIREKQNNGWTWLPWVLSLILPH